MTHLFPLFSPMVQLFRSVSCPASTNYKSKRSPSVFVVSQNDMLLPILGGSHCETEREESAYVFTTFPPCYAEREWPKSAYCDPNSKGSRIAKFAMVYITPFGIIIAVLLLLLICAALIVIVDKGEGNRIGYGSHWAVLVAGSKGFTNYRHQADVSRAFQILVRNGIPRNQIVVMMYDDVASCPENPFPGHLYCDCEGEDVYEGVRVDYRGDQVTADNVMNVLAGRADTMKHKGTGKVLLGTRESNVVLYFVDHGSSGFIDMPVGRPFTRDDLLASVDEMVYEGLFSHLLILVDSCKSESMVEGMSARGVYSMCASTGDEDSKALCPCADRYGVCVADEFSSAWMHFVQTASPSQTVASLVKNVTNYVVHSDVTTNGDETVSSMPIGHFFGWSLETDSNSSPISTDY